MRKVSIAVAVYNEEEYLKRCLDSLINQTYKNIEIILVDDCSTDNSLQICHEYAKKDNRIIVIEKETHTVLSDVRNVGIDHATGEYIMFVDSDDFVCENFVEEMVKAIEEKNVDAVRCKEISYKNENEYHIANVEWYSGKVIKGEELRQISKAVAECDEKGVVPNTWLFIIKLSVLKTKFNNKVYCAQDVLFLVEVLLESISSIYFLDKPLYYYCYNVKSITYSVSNYYKYLESILTLGEELKKVLSRFDLLDKESEEKLAYATFYRIKYKIFNSNNLTVIKIRKIIKCTLKNERVINVKASYNEKFVNYKTKFYKILVRLHFYFIIAICISISRTRYKIQIKLRSK